VAAAAWRWSDSAKAIIEWTAGLVLGVLVSPVMALTWAIVRLTTAGPGIYTQTRVGRGGHHFRIYKFRTMYHNCEAVGGAKWSTKGDTRVTPLGGILRKLHLDELPQLWNVLRGEMCLVGPRPERPEFVDKLSVSVPGYLGRLAVRPGVTGLAQIQLPPDTDLQSVAKKLTLDVCYINARGTWLDLRIILGTVVYLVGFSFTTVRKVFRLPNPLAAAQQEQPTRSEMPALTETQTVRVFTTGNK
jgi:lipopolysaccharide/colanic/teichoic acid biosynthesis glycosyltransferase